MTAQHNKNQATELEAQELMTVLDNTQQIQQPSAQNNETEKKLITMDAADLLQRSLISPV